MVRTVSRKVTSGRIGTLDLNPPPPARPVPHDKLRPAASGSKGQRFVFVHPRSEYRCRYHAGGAKGPQCGLAGGHAGRHVGYV